MIRKMIFAALCVWGLTLSACPPVQADPLPIKLPTWHVVGQAESLAFIGQFYGVSIQDIVTANSLTSPDRIYAGQWLYIPDKPITAQQLYTPRPATQQLYTPRPTAQSASSYSAPCYQVKRGDTLYSLGRAYGVSPQSIAAANGLADPNKIYAGQRLCIPGPTNISPSPQLGVYYIVKAGDTLYSLGRAYGVSPWSIAAANTIYNLNRIYAGQRLYIPTNP